VVEEGTKDCRSPSTKKKTGVSDRKGGKKGNYDQKDAKGQKTAKQKMKTQGGDYYGLNLSKRLPLLQSKLDK